MAQLPGAQEVAIARSKIVSYLLNLDHPDGGAKARYFMSHGFTPELWHILEAAIRRHPLDHPVHDKRRIADGRSAARTHYNVQCSLKTPNGANQCIQTVWALYDGDAMPYLITAYPV